MSDEMNTQLSYAANYDVDNMIFSKPNLNKIKNTTIQYYRIYVSTRNPDGTVGDLIFATEELFSFGVQENHSMDDEKKITGYTLPLCMWEQDAEKRTKAQLKWTDTFTAVVERCKDHLIEVKDSIGQGELIRHDLRKNFSPLKPRRDKETKAVIEGAAPMMYPKIIESKKNNQIITQFMDQNGNDLEMNDIIGKYCRVRAAIKIESIFIGSKINVQIKLHEAQVRLLQSRYKSLLPRPRPDNKVRMLDRVESSSVGEREGGGVEDEAGDMIDDDDDDDDGSINGDDDEKVAPPPVQKPPVKKVVRKVVKKRAAKAST